MSTTPRRPRLVVSDLDGTFLLPDGTVSRRNREAVLRAQAAGVPVLFATGRPVRWLDVIADLPGAHPTVIASNGAVLYDLGAREILDQVCIEPEVALDAVRRLRERLPGVAFAFETGLRFGHEPAYRPTHAAALADPSIRRAPVEELAGEQFVKLLVQDRTRRADALLAEVGAVLGDRLTATHSGASEIGLVEVSGPGVTKAAMLVRACARLGVEPRDVAAFGDMPNDVAMLSWVGLPHVVANAHPQLLDGRFPVVPANVDSGVGRTIDAWFADAGRLGADGSARDQHAARATEATTAAELSPGPELSAERAGR